MFKRLCKVAWSVARVLAAVVAMVEAVKKLLVHLEAWLRHVCGPDTEQA